MADAQPTTEASAAAKSSLSQQLLDFRELLPESLATSWQLIEQYPILGSLLIALIFYILAVIGRTLLTQILGRLTGLTSTTLDDGVVDVLRKPIFITIFLFGLCLATVVANLPFGRDFLLNFLASIIVASWMYAAIKLVTLILGSLSSTGRFTIIDARTMPLIDLTSNLLILMFGSYVLLMIWGINPLGWLASAGIAGLAIGFAAKDTLANLFSGFFIVADAPYKIGDYINLDTGERGKVSAIGLRSTRLLTRDDVEITIPNGVIANAKIINESGGPQTMRIRIVVGVAYGSDVDLVSELLMLAGTEHMEVCNSPEPRIRLRGFGASSLDFNLMCWIYKPEDRGRIAHELHIRIYKLFNEHKVEIPYAKQDLYIKQWPNLKND
jgi:small-conductance mechanosensitive channel